MQSLGHLGHIVMGDLLFLPVFLLHIRDIGDPLIFHLKIDLLIGLVQGGEVVGQHPAHPREDGGGGRYDGNPQDQSQQRIPPLLLFLLPCALPGGRTIWLLLPLRLGVGGGLPDLAAVPAGGMVAILMIHGAILLWWMKWRARPSPPKEAQAEKLGPAKNIFWCPSCILPCSHIGCLRLISEVNTSCGTTTPAAYGSF